MESKQTIWILVIVIAIIFISGCAPEEIVEELQQEIATPIIKEEVAEKEKIEEPKEPYLPEQLNEEEQKKIPGQPPPVFTHHITDLSKIAYIIPPLLPPHSYHSYLGLKQGVPRVAVYAPADAEFFEVTFYHERGDGVPEYKLVFRVNDNFFYYFDHVIDPIPKIKAVSPKEPQPFMGAPDLATSSVFIQAGDLIAYSEGTLQARNWDFGVYDVTHKNKMANPTRHIPPGPTSKNVPALGPYDFFPDDRIMPASECPDVSRDIVGTASGYWYLDSGTDETYEYRLEIAAGITGNVNWIGVGRGRDQTYVDQVPTDPVDVTVGQSACYFDDVYFDNKISNRKHLFIKLLSETELGIFYGEGSCPKTFPEEGYKIYVR